MTEEQKTTTDKVTEATPVTDTPTPVETKETTEKTEPAAQAPDAKPATDAPVKPATDAAKTDRPAQRGGRGGAGGGFRGRGGGGRGGRRPMRREKPEFDQKIVSLRRVTRVMAGGRRFSFSCAIVIGDRKGRVGFGIGKAGDTAAAIDKAVRVAKKDMIHVKRTATNSIPFDSQAKYKASEVYLRPVSGKGLAAGGGVRVVLELAGIDEVGGKLLSRSKNNINNAKATLLALKPFTTS